MNAVRETKIMPIYQIADNSLRQIKEKNIVDRFKPTLSLSTHTWK